MAQTNHRAVMVYVIQCESAVDFAFTPDLDPLYLKTFKVAATAGVEAIALTCHVSPDKITIIGQVPILELL